MSRHASAAHAWSRHLEDLSRRFTSSKPGMHRCSSDLCATSCSHRRSLICRCRRCRSYVSGTASRRERPDCDRSQERRRTGLGQSRRRRRGHRSSSTAGAWPLHCSAISNDPVCSSPHAAILRHRCSRCSATGPTRVRRPVGAPPWFTWTSILKARTLGSGAKLRVRARVRTAALMVGDVGRQHAHQQSSVALPRPPLATGHARPAGQLQIPTRDRSHEVWRDRLVCGDSKDLHAHATKESCRAMHTHHGVANAAVARTPGRG